MTIAWFCKKKVESADHSIISDFRLLENFCTYGNYLIKRESNGVPYFWTGQFFKWVEKLTTHLWGHNALNTEMSESIETAVKKTSIIYCTCFTAKTSWQILQWLAFLTWKLHSALSDSLLDWSYCWTMLFLTTRKYKP